MYSTLIEENIETYQFLICLKFCEMMAVLAVFRLITADK